MYRNFMLPGIRSVTASLVLFVATASHAALTPVLPGPGHEPGLIGVNGILDDRFGLENLVRIDDSIDQYWRNDGHIVVKTLAKWAGFGQSFGYINASGDFSQLLNVSNKWSRPAGSFRAEDSGGLFRFGLDPGGSPLWSSAPSTNSDALDHMVTWQITASRNRGLIGAYITAWEDLAGGGDRDYNDLVLLIKGDASLHTVATAEVLAAVPVPAALWLFASGLLGLGVFARRSNTL